MGGPHTQVRCLFKAFISGTFNKNVLIYSQMRFQLHQSHSLTAIGLKSGKKSIKWVSVGILGTSMKLQISNLSHTNITERTFI